MRNEISMPQQWRTTCESVNSHENWGPVGRCDAKRRSQSMAAQLEPAVVDAALEQENLTQENIASNPTSASRRRNVESITASHSNSDMPVRIDLVQSISSQLAMIEAQREQLQQMLNEAISDRQ